MQSNFKPPYWYQGVFLQPQHFQYQELFFDYQIDNLRRFLNDFLWGVAKIRFRENALDEHVLDLLSGTVWFQDGTIVNIPENGVVQPRSFKEMTERIDPEKPLRVYLALKRLEPDQKNVEIVNASVNLNKIRTRFIADENPETAPNLYEGGHCAEIAFLRYPVKIIVDNEVADHSDYLCIPVAEIEFLGDSLQFSRKFLPPVPTLWASPILRDILRDIQDTIISRARRLEVYKTARPLRLEDFEGNYIRYFHALLSLNQFIPVLQHIIENPSIHPIHIYAIIRQLIGTLSTFSENINALGKSTSGSNILPGYNHENLYYCFNNTKIIIKELLNSIVIGDENIYELKRNVSRFTGELSVSAFDKNSIISLLVCATGDRKSLLQSLQNHAKIGDSHEMDNLLNRSLSGLSIEYHETSLPGITVPPNGLFFTLNTSGPIWDKIRNSNLICLYWAEAPDDATAEIIVSRK